MSKFEGKVAVVTGAGQGQGRVVANRLAQEGAAVVVADIIEETAKAVAEEINKGSGRAVPAVADLAEYNQAEEVISLALSRFGQVDILCNVAGNVPRGDLSSHGKKFWETTPEDWIRDIRHNIYTCLCCCRAVVGHMMERRYGKIVNWEGAAVLPGSDRTLSVYMAAKGAVYTFTKCLARELGPYNITVNSIGPGPIISSQMIEQEQERWAERIKSIPLGRLGTAEDIAALTSFLVSDEASWISGQSICVSGGEFTR